MSTRHEVLPPSPRRWIQIVGAIGGTALGLGALAFAAGSLAVVTDLGRGPTAAFGLAAAVLSILGGLAVGAAWLGRVIAGRSGLAPMFGAFAVAGTLVGAQFIDDGPGMPMVKGLILIAGLIVCALAHFNLPRERDNGGSGAIRGGATLALVGLAATAMAYARSIELPLGLAMALIIAGFLGITVLGFGVAFRFASLRDDVRARPDQAARS